MDRIFIVPGYGVPEDIFKDLKYCSYLNFAFNHIFEYSSAHKDEKISVILSGGRTDMVKPYKRSEAGEMKRYIDFLRKRDFVKSVSGRWNILTDTASLSTLENVLNSQKIMEIKKISGGEIDIFCEFTRKKRVAKLAKIVFGSRLKIRIVPIDFSISANRYIGRDYLLQKEKNALAFDLWATESDDNLKAYHKNFIDKFNFFRSYGQDRKEEAIRVWWDKEAIFCKDSCKKKRL